MMDYVTYSPDGKLTGGYSQELQADHRACFIEVTVEIRQSWTSYQANVARDWIELSPLELPSPSVISVPIQVTSRQAHAALIKRGLDVPINAYIDAIADPIERKLTRNEFERAADFERNWPLVMDIGAALDLDLDELFIFAATL